LFRVAAASLIFTYLFFAEYLSPLRRVHIPWDLQGYHYPLAGYAFQALKEGRFPQWDPTMYCGMSFVGNIQAALFYPPTWLMFAANWSHTRLSYQSLQVLTLAHVWLAFFLCYLWLRGKRLCDVACVLGAAVFAFSGYMCLQLQHFGLIAGYAWLPLGLMGIDQVVERRQWWPFSKLIAASALCFLAGYPSTWVAFTVCMLAYALFKPWGFRTILGTAASLGASFAVAMIQAWPLWEQGAYAFREPHYGTGIKQAEFFLSYLLPNYFNFGMNVSIFENPGREYLYLGAPALLGIACCFRRRNPRELIPFLAVGVVSLIAVTNPFGMVSALIKHSSFLNEICRDYYFLAGLTLAAAPLTAYGLDDFLNRKTRPAANSLTWLALASMGAWSGWELLRWLKGGLEFASGWRSVYDPAITLAVFAFALYVLRARRGAIRMTLAVALVLAAGIDYKVFGTSKRFNASADPVPPRDQSQSFPGMDLDAYRQLRAHATYRIVLDQPGPNPVNLRQMGLLTPQGYDPLITSQYRELVQPAARFRSDRLFDINPDKEDMLRLLGVRYIVTSESGPLYPGLLKNRSFRLVGYKDGYYRVFEYTGARPPFGWDYEAPDRQAKLLEWSPESRRFMANSDAGGRFTLHEQFLPGWRATVDGKPAGIERWMGAFQSVTVPPGEHIVQFQFQSTGLQLGKWISLIALLALAAWGVVAHRAGRSGL
jgi:hypothetical protein